MENDFLKLLNFLSSKGQGVKVLNRNLRGHELLLAGVGGTAWRPAPRPLPSRLAAAGRRGWRCSGLAPQGSSEGRREGGPPPGQPGKKTFFQRKQLGAPLASPALRLLGTVRPRPAPRVEAEGHSPCFATPVGMVTPWGARGADYSHPSAMTPFRSAQYNFRAGQGFLEP